MKLLIPENVEIASDHFEHLQTSVNQAIKRSPEKLLVEFVDSDVTVDLWFDEGINLETHGPYASFYSERLVDAIVNILNEIPKENIIRCLLEKEQ